MGRAEDDRILSELIHAIYDAACGLSNDIRARDGLRIEATARAAGGMIAAVCRGNPADVSATVRLFEAGQ